MVTNVQAEQFLAIFMGKSNTYVKNDLPKQAPKAGQKIKTNIILKVDFFGGGWFLL